MREIKCRRCGAILDAEQGECPVCGAMYYILPQESGEEEPNGDRIPETGTIPPVVGVPDARFYEPGSETAAEEDSFGEERTGEAPETEEPDGDDFVVEIPDDLDDDDTVVWAAAPAHKAAAVHERKAAAAPLVFDKPRRVTGYIVGATVMLAVLTVLLCVMSGAFDFHKNDTEPMPELVGLSESLAVSTLENLGVTPSVYRVASDEAEGIVIAQSPEANTMLKKSSAVQITISSGPAAPEETMEPDPELTITVPRLVGHTWAEAETLLKDTELLIADGGLEYSNYTEGQIIRQEPTAGTQAAPGTVVVVVRSRGPETPEEHTISVTVGKGGSVSPRGRVTVSHEDSQTFTFVPDEGYEVREIIVDGQNVGASRTYVFTDVVADHSLYVVFGLRTGGEETPGPANTPVPEATRNPATPSDIRP
ncbi:MAG: PASTA domain-containing protein [Eubacteriales bacterium]|nr:PASTA domain-containing protein [Eubacteriales bacterium]